MVFTASLHRNYTVKGRRNYGALFTLIIHYLLYLLNNLFLLNTIYAVAQAISKAPIMQKIKIPIPPASGRNTAGTFTKVMAVSACSIFPDAILP